MTPAEKELRQEVIMMRDKCHRVKCPQCGWETESAKDSKACIKCGADTVRVQPRGNRVGI